MSKDKNTKLAEVIGKSAEELEALKAKLAESRKLKNRAERIVKTADEKKAKLLEQIEAAKAGTRLTLTQIKEKKKDVKAKLAEVNKELKENAAAVKTAQEIDKLEEQLAKIRKEKGLDTPAKKSSGSSPKPGFVKALMNRGWNKIMVGRRVTDLTYTAEGKERWRVVVAKKEGWTIQGEGIANPETMYEYKGGIAQLDSIVAEAVKASNEEEKAAV